MHLILGLGNLGEKYATTRHNFGFRVLDSFVAKNSFPDFKLNKKLKAEVSSAEFCGKKILLAKPQTFMNLSGESARAILDFYKLSPADVIAVYDDIDLPFSALRIRSEGGSGGHNGVKNLIAHLGTEKFTRIRLGIQNKLAEKIPAEDFVLANFTDNEKKALPEILKKTVNALEEIAKNGVKLAGNKFNS